MLVTHNEFMKRTADLRERIRRACDAAGRMPETVRVLPVTKTHPLEAVKFAGEAGFPAIGENRVQEAMAKRADPACPRGLSWELIGHLQSNKAKDAVAHFDRIQSVDSQKLADRLNRFSGETGKRLRVLLQVNAGNDAAKYGVSVEDAPGLAKALLEMQHLELEGLMTVAPLSEDPQVARRTFSTLRTLRDTLQERLGVPLPELSMGMTDDLETAIEEGSTLLRVGTALFGRRD